MSKSVSNPILFDSDAGAVAFRAGQLVEKLLLDRALKRAGESGASIVKPEIIEACIDESLLDDLKRHLNEQTEREAQKVA